MIKPSSSLLPLSVRSDETSSLNSLFNSDVVTYLSRATRSSIRRMMSTVVSTPTSEEMSASSKSSKTSSSTFDFPTTMRASLLKTFVFVFSSPASRTSFFSFLENRLKNPIAMFSWCKLTNLFSYLQI